MTHCQDVKLFHDKFDLKTPESFTHLQEDLQQFRLKFLYEEFQEYVDSCKCGDLGYAVDSLIDLVYICCGTALLHGLSPDKFEKVLSEYLANGGNHLLFDFSAEPIHFRPEHLSPAVNAAFTQLLQESIEDYGFYSSKLAGKSIGVCSSLCAIYFNCLNAATAIGLKDHQWQEVWNEVQRANMSKERVLRAEDSKRGSTWDVRKPPGWLPPRTEAMVEQYQREYTPYLEQIWDDHV